MTPTAIANLQVLIVEDSATQAMQLKDSLEKNQLRVKVAKDGIEALEEMKRGLPDVVVSDIAMPRLDGFGFCKQVRATPEFKNVPIILLTSLSDPMDVIKGIATGADSFLTKPCEINFLLSTMHDVVENKNAHAAIQGQPLAFFFNGQHHVLHIDQVQITNLLLSTYLDAVQKNTELEQSYKKLNEAYEEIKDKNDELKKLNDQKNQLLGMAAHDLRDPLGVIIGYSNIVKTSLAIKADEKTLKMLDKISNSSAFMLRLVNDLLDTSVVESGKVSLHLADVNLTELISDNLIYLTTLAEKKGIRINVDTKNFTTKVRCDPNKIAQVLSNLVTNAITFSRAGTSIDLSLEPTINGVTLSVKDSGIGIAPDIQKQLFQPAGTEKGLPIGKKTPGLGLAIAHKIITEHKGKIWFETVAGKGSTFYVSLPLIA